MALHVYFPDPWPKARHRRRRLLRPASVDLLLGLLEPGGVLYFASDHREYAVEVRELLAAHPAVELREREQAWPDGPRTNYEIKYESEARPIVRLEARLLDGVDLLHPAGVAAIVAGPARVPGLESDGDG